MLSASPASTSSTGPRMLTIPGSGLVARCQALPTACASLASMASESPPSMHDTTLRTTTSDAGRRRGHDVGAAQRIGARRRELEHATGIAARGVDGIGLAEIEPTALDQAIVQRVVGLVAEHQREVAEVLARTAAIHRIAHVDGQWGAHRTGAHAMGGGIGARHVGGGIAQPAAARV